MALYRFRDGFRAQGQDPQRVGVELERIRLAHGRLTTTLVREEAAPEDAVLHDCLTWDTDEALIKLQEIEARTLIRSVILVEETGPPEGVEAYYHVPSPRGEGHYQPAHILVERPDEFALAVEELRKRFNSAEVALRHLERTARVSTDADRLLMINLVLQAFSAARAALLRL